MPRFTLLFLALWLPLAAHGAPVAATVDERAAAVDEAQLRESGAAQARRELAEGGPIVLTEYGLPPPPLHPEAQRWKTLTDEVHARRGVVTRLGGCIPPEAGRRAYDAEMHAELERRFGKTFHADVAAEARAMLARESAGAR